MIASLKCIKNDDIFSQKTFNCKYAHRYDHSFPLRSKEPKGMKQVPLTWQVVILLEIFVIDAASIDIDRLLFQSQSLVRTKGKVGDK